MQSAHQTPTHGRRSAGRRVTAPPLVVRRSIVDRVGVGVTALALVAGLSISPAGPAQASPGQALATAQQQPRPAGQIYVVDADVVAPPIVRDGMAATDGVQTLTSNGTNADWAKLVLMDGGWPTTDQNITVLLRWMRQENGPPDWWNRNNPLNNGFGSGGGAGLGSYGTLQDAAQYAAANLHRGYPGIAGALASSASAEVTAQAIWASPWATSHYANGAHWSTAPVQIVKAPASAWGG
jgi:hypothetical protein